MESILRVEFILTAFLIFVRVGALVMTAPFFSSGTIPVKVKAFFAIVLTLMMYPVVSVEGMIIPIDATSLEVLVAVVKEMLVGVAMGLTGQLIFAGIQMGGELMSVNIGLSFASVVDPVNQGQRPLVSQLFGLLAVLVFISVGGGAYYLQALAESFEIVPVGDMHLQRAAPTFIQIATYLFVIGVQMAAPFIIVLFLLDLSFAIFARIMPQANIFFIALPLKVGVGVILMLLILPYAPAAFDNFFSRLWTYLDRILQVI